MLYIWNVLSYVDTFMPCVNILANALFMDFLSSDLVLGVLSILIGRCIFQLLCWLGLLYIYLIISSMPPFVPLFTLTSIVARSEL